MSDAGQFPISSGNPDEDLRNGASADAGPQDTAGKIAADRSERRRRRRALISAPVRVRSTYGRSNSLDEISTTVDVSRNGFLFLSKCSGFSRGMTVAVTFPYSKSPAALQAEQPGRVVRVSALPDGCFAVAVAIGTATAELEAECANVRPANGTSMAPPERPLVVVVDADVEVRESLRKLLSAQGYEVIALPGARQAHALLNQLLPALLIAEIEGEDLPGLDLCARIKSTPRLKDVPVVLTTRSAYPSDYANAHSLGAVVCIAKPFRMARVGHVVRLLVPQGVATAS
jgi:CheY-like chemotaxis protein